jgi:hypothetical protein
MAAKTAASTPGSKTGPRNCDKASIFRVNHKTATNGKGHTQFARALFELNIEGLFANTAGAKGRVERAHLTLQDGHEARKVTSNLTLQYERKIYMLADNLGKSQTHRQIHRCPSIPGWSS